MSKAWGGGKGSARRPEQIGPDAMAERWTRTFTHHDRTRATRDEVRGHVQREVEARAAQMGRDKRSHRNDLDA